MQATASLQWFPAPKYYAVAAASSSVAKKDASENWTATGNFKLRKSV